MSENPWLDVSEEELAYHLRQYEAPYRSTVASIEFLKARAGFTKDSALRILDVGSGAGANVHWLAREFPRCSFTGLDLSPALTEEARRLNAGLSNVEFVTMDFRQAPSLGVFDYVLSFQVASWLSPTIAAELFEAKLACARKGVFLTSLFCEDDIDYEIKVSDHSQPKSSFYNIYSLRSFRERAEAKAFELSHVQKFEIDIDLPKPRGIGTYTVKALDGERLQFSGALYLPWYFLLFTKTDEAQK